MNYTENYRGIKIDVQSVHLDISDAVQQEIRSSIDKLSKFTPDINGVDIYFKTEGQGASAENLVGFRVYVPGPDAFAEVKGENWVPMLKEAVDKLIRQLQKNK
nr:30S ribosomal protein S30 [Cytophagales bacterium]